MKITVDGIDNLKFLVDPHELAENVDRVSEWTLPRQTQTLKIAEGLAEEGIIKRVFPYASEKAALQLSCSQYFRGLLGKFQKDPFLVRVGFVDYVLRESGF